MSAYSKAEFSRIRKAALKIREDGAPESMTAGEMAARQAYTIADAMLKEREKRRG